MRIDLTPGAYRVLRQADLLTQPKGISIAAVLCALFEETECRACQWLEDAELKVEDFRLQFGFYEGLPVTLELHSPVSAPMFPAGSYGVPPGAVTTPRAREDVAQSGAFESIDSGKSGTREFSSALSNGPSDNPPDVSPQQEQQEPDQLIVSESPPPMSHFVRPSHRKKRESSSLEWFVNEAQVRFYKVLIEIDHAILSVLNRIHQLPDASEAATVLGSGGMVMKIKASPLAGFQESAFELATEHLLLAVALADDPLGAGAWVRSHGLDPTVVYEKILQLHRKQETWEEPSPQQDVDVEAEMIMPPPKSPELPELEPVLPSQIPDVSSSSLIRLLDAAANRAMEAVRVIEDYVRFMLDDPGLTGFCKAFRHDLATLLAEIPHRQRMQCRDTPGDVGTELQGSREYRRDNLEDVLASNFSRLQESLRSLEEYGKMVSIPLSQGLERLRYRAYSLHKDVFQTAKPVPADQTGQADQTTAVVGQVDPRTLFQDALLYVLIDCRDTETAFTELVQALADAGADVIQLRDKQADDRTLLERGKVLRRLTAESRTLFIMNDRPDLARLTQADGVHVGQNELSVRQVREIVGTDMLIGVSTHSERQIQEAIADGADYIGVGPIFASATKSFSYELPGLELLNKLSEETPPIPAFAIGGITSDNLNEVLATGIGRIAVSAAVVQSADPEEETRLLKQMLHLAAIEPELYSRSAQ